MFHKRSFCFSIYFLLFSITANAQTMTNQIHKPTVAEIEKSIDELNRVGPNYEGQFLQIIQMAGDDAIPIIKSRITNSPSLTKQVLLSGLRTIKAPCYDVAETAADLLKDPLWLTRYNALLYLSVMKCAEHRPKILSLLDSEKHPSVSRAAIDSLGFIGIDKDTPRLLQIQNDESQNLDLRISATTSLIKLKQPYASNVLTKGISDKNYEIKIKSLGALSLTSDKSVMNLIRPLTTDPQVGPWAQIAIEAIDLNQPQLPMKKRRDRLFSLIDGKNPTLTTWAVNELMTQHKSPDTIAKLKERAMHAPGSTASSSQPQKERLGIQRLSNVESNIILKVLEEEKAMTQREIINFYRGEK